MTKKFDQYESLNQLATKYKEYYNSSYKAEPWKHFSLNDIIDICTEKIHKPFMIHRYSIESCCYVIKNFGYAIIK